MIEDAPRIRIGDTTRRPTARQIAALTGAATGHVVDALGGAGAMDYRIKPVVAGQHDFCGPALICDSGAADNLGLIASLEARNKTNAGTKG